MYGVPSSYEQRARLLLASATQTTVMDPCMPTARRFTAPRPP